MYIINLNAIAPVSIFIIINVIGLKLLNMWPTINTMLIIPIPANVGYRKALMTSFKVIPRPGDSRLVANINNIG